MAEIEYYSYSEFVDYAENRKKHPNCGSENSRGRDRFDFTQIKNFKTALSYAREGWDLGLEQFKIEDGVFANGSTEINASLSGCIPHVQNFIMGFPEQMYQLVDKREYNLPTLDLVVPLNYASWVNSEDALNFGKSVVAFINKMASSYNIRLKGIFCLQFGGKTKVQVVTLKDFDESLVLNNIAYAFHPSFFRTIWFSVIEGKSYWSWGYGSNNKEYKKHIEGILDGVKADKTIYFKSLMENKKYIFTPEEIEEVIL